MTVSYQSYPLERPTLRVPAILERHSALIDEMLEPSIELESNQGVHGPAEGSRLFGSPFLSHPGDWPRTPEGIPMFFVGQLNFEEISAVYPLREKPLPRGGVLSFFYDLDSMPLGVSIEDRYRFRLVWIPRGMGGAPVDPLPGAPLLDAPERRLSARPSWTLPGEMDERFRLGPLEEEEFLAYEALSRGEPARVGHRVLGHADWIDEDVRARCAEITAGFFSSGADLSGARPPNRKAEWRLLWQIGGEPELDRARGEEARIFIMIRDEDLVHRRFDRSWAVVQS
jgi:uncharacterized protein YwqG